MESSSVRVAPFSNIIDLRQLEADESAAIDGHKYEEAQQIYEKIQSLKAKQLEDQKTHYLSERDNINKISFEEMEKQLTDNQDLCTKETDSAMRVYEECMEEAKDQNSREIDRLHKEWESARAQAKERILKAGNSMLETSKLLAKSHQFGEAIEVRNKALHIIGDDSHRDLVEVDKKYELREHAMKERHEQFLSELEEHFSRNVSFMRDGFSALETTAKSQHEVDVSSSPRIVIQTVLSNSGDTVSAIPIIKEVSPLKPKATASAEDNTSSGCCTPKKAAGGRSPSNVRQ